MYKFRIKEDLIKSGGFDVKYYTVEKNICYFWWIRESKQVYGIVDVFEKYDDAINYIENYHGGGILMYIY